MNANRQTIDREPTLFVLDPSDETSVGLFNTFVMEHAGIVQAALPTDEVVKVERPARPAPEGDVSEEAQRIEKVTDAIRGLLTAAHNGRSIDYDNGTWGEITEDTSYREEVRKMHGMDRRNPAIEDQRRRVAVTGLGIYASRVIQFAAQTETDPFEEAPDETRAFIAEAEQTPLPIAVEPIPEPGMA